MNIVGLAKAISDIAQRTRNKKLLPDEVTGGTFTITNFGVFGAVFGTPIINQPEVAILGVGAVAKKPVVINVDDSDVNCYKTNYGPYTFTRSPACRWYAWRFVY